MIGRANNMHSKSVESLSLTRAGFIEYFLVATKLVHALTAIAPALFLLYYPGLVPAWFPWSCAATCSGCCCSSARSR